MEAKIISLKCSSCSGLLQVNERFDKITCTYCGSEQLIIKSENNNVSLKKIEDKLSSVTSSSNKTAAELAITRLEKDLKLATFEYDDSFGELDKKTVAARDKIVSYEGIQIICGIGFFASVFLMGANWILASVVIGLPVAGICRHQIKSIEKELENLKKKYVPKHQELVKQIYEMRESLEKNLEIVK